jgi:ABC-type multidrug transport system fused ATPase/permease subunit
MAAVEGYPETEKEKEEVEETETQTKVKDHDLVKTLKSEKIQQRDEIVQFLKTELRQQAIPLVLGTLAMVGSTLANQALPKLLGKLLDSQSQSSSSSLKASSTPTSMTGTLMVVALGGGLASFVRTVLLNRAQEGIAARLRCKIIASLLIDRDLQFFSSMHSSNPNPSEQSSSDSTKVVKGTPTATAPPPSSSTTTLSSPAAILSILQTDVASVSSAFTTTLANTFRSICSTGFSTYHLISLHPPLRLQLSLFSLIPLFGISAVTIHKKIKTLTKKQILLQDAASTFAEERISHITTVHIHNRQGQDAQLYQTLQDKIVLLGRAVSFHKGIFMGFLFAGGATALASIFSLGGTIVAQGYMTNGDLTRYVYFNDRHFIVFESILLKHTSLLLSI